MGYVDVRPEVMAILKEGLDEDFARFIDVNDLELSTMMDHLIEIGLHKSITQIKIITKIPSKIGMFTNVVRL